MGWLKRIILKKEENGWFCFGVRLGFGVMVKFFGERGVFIIGGFFYFILYYLVCKNNFIFGGVKYSYLKVT